LAVELVELVFVAGDEAETNNAHVERCSEIELAVVLNPIGKKPGKSNVLPQSRGHSFAAKAAEDHPRFQRPKPAAELDAVSHIIFLRLDRVAAQIFRHQCEDASQSLDIAHIKHAKIERNEKSFVRIHDDGIGFAPTGWERL